jgi:hypothetical protein
MTTEYCITTRHVQELIADHKCLYGGFSNPAFHEDLGVSCSTEEEYTRFLLSLTEPSDIIRYIVEFVISLVIFKPIDFREGDQILYVNGKLEVDVTETYKQLNSYYSNFETY